MTDLPNAYTYVTTTTNTTTTTDVTDLSPIEWRIDYSDGTRFQVNIPQPFHGVPPVAEVSPMKMAFRGRIIQDYDNSRILTFIRENLKSPEIRVMANFFFSSTYELFDEILKTEIELIKVARKKKKSSKFNVTEIIKSCKEVTQEEKVELEDVIL
jgi:hypothetical protein